MISEQTKQRMRDLAARYPVARSVVMPALSIAQQEEEYTSDEFVERVTLEKADALIDKWKKESEHLCQN